MPKEDDIDWGGLLLFGSLLGNLVQIQKSDQSQRSIQERDLALQNLLADRDALIQNLRNFHRAVESFRQKTIELENINRDLLGERDEMRQTIAELREKINVLEEDKSRLAVEYAEKLEKIISDQNSGNAK